MKSISQSLCLFLLVSSFSVYAKITQKEISHAIENAFPYSNQNIKIITWNIGPEQTEAWFGMVRSIEKMVNKSSDKSLKSVFKKFEYFSNELIAQLKSNFNKNIKPYLNSDLPVDTAPGYESIYVTGAAGKNAFDLAAFKKHFNAVEALVKKARFLTLFQEFKGDLISIHDNKMLKLFYFLAEKIETHIITAMRNDIKTIKIEWFNILTDN